MASVEIMRIGQATEGRLGEIASLHRASIPSGFLTSLGQAALSAIYGAIIRSPNAFMLVALQDDRCVGFLAASLSTRRVQCDIMATAWRQLAPAVLRQGVRPKIWLGIAELLMYTAKSRRRVATPAAEILNFCVDPSCRGEGIGGTLFRQMSLEYAMRGVREISIVTGAAQLAAQNLYESRGAVRVGEVLVHRKARAVSYCYKVPQESDHSRLRSHQHE
jgi:ribosomal protein S18 acetylase RimI-like enzyme